MALEEPGSEIDDRDEATLLLRLAGASTLAILALAVASLVIV